MNPQIIAVRELFSKLERNGVRYCVLRNYGFLLDEKIPWESLDISIAKDDFLKADAILGQEGFSRRKPQFSLRHRAYFKLIRDTIVSFDVQVGGVYWNDMSYLGESIFKHRIKKSFFYVPSDNDTFVMLTAHSILGKRYFKPKYQQILSSLQIEGDYVLQELSVIFSQRIAKSLLQSIRHNDFKHIKIYSPLFHFLFKEWQHLKTFSLLSLRWLRWKKFLQPWPLISIIGPDGA